MVQDGPCASTRTLGGGGVPVRKAQGRRRAPRWSRPRGSRFKVRGQQPTLASDRIPDLERTCIESTMSSFSPYATARFVLGPYFFSTQPLALSSVCGQVPEAQWNASRLSPSTDPTALHPHAGVRAARSSVTTRCVTSGSSSAAPAARRHRIRSMTPGVWLKYYKSIR